MQYCRNIVPRLIRQIVGHTKAIMWLSTVGRAWRTAVTSLGLAIGALIAQSTPVDAQATGTYCDLSEVSDDDVGVEQLAVCQGPSIQPSEDISGSMQRQIQQRLQQLRCEGSDDPACAGAGGAAADSASFEGLGVFVSADYQHKDKTATDFEQGFESDSVGPTIGVDYRLGTYGVIGAAFDYSHAFGDYDDGYGDFDTDTYTLVLYGSYYPTDQSFIDVSFGVGRKEFDNEHIDEGDLAGTVEGDTDGFEFTADLTGGYDFNFGAFTVGPRLGLHYKRTDMNGFSETSSDPGALLDTYFDNVDDSLTGTVGVQASYAISTGFGVVVPSVNAEYVREFLDDREHQTALLDGSPVPARLILDQPDRNHFNVGAGAVVLLPGGVFPFINYETELANYLEETHTFTGGVRLDF